VIQLKLRKFKPTIPNTNLLIPMTNPRIPLKLEDQSDGPKTSLREDGSLTPESKDHSRIKSERVKSDQRFSNSETNLTLMLKSLLIQSPKRNPTRKPPSLKELKIKLLPRPRKPLIKVNLRKI